LVEVAARCDGRIHLSAIVAIVSPAVGSNNPSCIGRIAVTSVA
jgi:hypothetical protein